MNQIYGVVSSLLWLKPPFGSLQSFHIHDSLAFLSLSFHTPACSLYVSAYHLMIGSLQLRWTLALHVLKPYVTSRVCD